MRKLNNSCLSVAYGLHPKIGRKRVDGFGAHAVQADGFLEHLAVVFRTCIELRDGFLQLAQWDAASIVANADLLFGLVHRHLNLLAEARSEFVDGVVNHLFDKHIDAVILGSAVAELADVHTRAATDVLHVLKVDDAVVVIVFYSRSGVFVLCKDVVVDDFAHKK